MTVQCLSSATAHAKQVKGEIIAIKTVPPGDEGSPLSSWGTKETLPNYIIVEITGATKAQAEAFLEKATDAWDYDVVTAGGLHTITATINPKILNNFDNGMKQDVRTFLEDNYDAIFTTWTPETGTAVFTVPDTTDTAAMKADTVDIFTKYLGPRYKWSNADVDATVTAGGFNSVTKTVAENRIVDRLA